MPKHDLFFFSFLTFYKSKFRLSNTDQKYWLSLCGRLDQMLCGQFDGLAVGVGSFLAWLSLWIVSWSGCQCGQFNGLAFSVAASWPGCLCGQFPGLAVGVASLMTWLSVWPVLWPGFQCGQFYGLAFSVDTGVRYVLQSCYFGHQTWLTYFYLGKLSQYNSKHFRSNLIKG